MWGEGLAGQGGGWHRLIFSKLAQAEAAPCASLQAIAGNAAYERVVRVVCSVLGILNLISQVVVCHLCTQLVATGMQHPLPLPKLNACRCLKQDAMVAPEQGLRAAHFIFFGGAQLTV